MGLLADRIEKLILDKILQGDDDSLILKRNELADELNCAPSQISYVLSTRFSSDKGFHVQSRRGLGGYISITRVARSGGHVETTVQTGTSLPLVLSRQEEERILAFPIDAEAPATLQEADHWIGRLLYGEKLNNREARLLHNAFAALFAHLQGEDAQRAASFLYETVLQEMRGE